MRQVNVEGLGALWLRESRSRDFGRVLEVSVGDADHHVFSVSVVARLLSLPIQGSDPERLLEAVAVEVWASRIVPGLAEYLRGHPGPATLSMLAGVRIRCSSDETVIKHGDADPDDSDLVDAGAGRTMGRHEEYALERRPLGKGAYAEVYPARHRTTGNRVALKRLLSQRDDDARQRMRREIDVLRRLAHPNIVEMLDAAEDHDWYTMPVADGTLDRLRSTLDDAKLRDALIQISRGLGAAHVLGLVHRDVTPRNVLAFRLAGGELVWKVSDWGLVRRPLGQTTTRLTSEAVGTEGFRAPESWDDSHDVTERADIYGLGRVAAWAVTGSWPRPNLPLLPDGPWRVAIRAMTAHRAEDRPARMEDAAQLLSNIGAVSVEQSAVALFDASVKGDGKALRKFVDLAVANPDDRDLYLDQVAELPDAALAAVAKTDPAILLAMGQAMHGHLLGDMRGIDFDSMNRFLFFLQRSAQAASAIGQIGVASDLIHFLIEGDVRWDRWKQKRRTLELLGSLRGDLRDAVTQSIRAIPGAAEYYDDSPIAHPPVERTEAPATGQEDEVKLLLSRYGAPDVDESTQFDEPRPPLVTRWLVYKAEEVRAMYLARGAVGDPPPYAAWKFIGFQDPKSDEVLEVSVAAERLKGRLRTVRR